VKSTNFNLSFLYHTGTLTVIIDHNIAFASVSTQQIRCARALIHSKAKKQSVRMRLNNKTRLLQFPMFPAQDMFVISKTAESCHQVEFKIDAAVNLETSGLHFLCEEKIKHAQELPNYPRCNSRSCPQVAQKRQKTIKGMRRR